MGIRRYEDIIHVSTSSQCWEVLALDCDFLPVVNVRIIQSVNAIVERKVLSTTK